MANMGHTQHAISVDADASASAASRPAAPSRPTAWQLAFIVLVMAVLCIPFAGMAIAPTTTTTENRDLAEAPSLITEAGGLNIGFLQDAGEYFNDHYALRNMMVDADARLRTAVFGVSNTDSVIVGANDWLYYDGTLDDYLGTGALSDRSLENIAYNLAIVQQYVESKGASFTFTIAPNKNSLYPQNMPARYLATDEASNASRLEPYLSRYGINYANLFEAFSQAQGEDPLESPLYYKRDTHWNNKGALLAYNTILRQAGIEHETFADRSWSASNDYVGDINEMLYPVSAQTEWDVHLDPAPEFSYTSDSTSVEDDFVSTSSQAGQGTLLMFRDSFGNSLLPLMASQFSQAYFSKLVPYNLGLAGTLGASAVVIERAERNISALALDPPMLEGPHTSALPVGREQSGTTVETSTDGDFLVVQGAIDASFADEASYVFVTIAKADGSEAVSYQAYRTTTGLASSTESDDASEDEGVNDLGYKLFVNNASLPDGDLTATVSIVRDGQLVGIADAELKR